MASIVQWNCNVAGYVGAHRWMWPGQSFTQWRIAVSSGITEVVETEQRKGAPPSRRRPSRYPRRVFIDGKVYWAQNAAEERALLQRHAVELEYQVAVAEEPVARRAKVVLRRIERRIEKVSTRETDWLEQLRREDDDILAMLD